MTSASPVIDIFLLPGSQFCAKVLVALDSRGLAYNKLSVPLFPLSARRKALPSGGRLVPEMAITPNVGKSEREIVPDSTAILRRLDALLPTTDVFYPTKEIENADKHCGAEVNALLLYFNHVSIDGWTRSIRAYTKAQLPPLIREVIPYNWLYGSTRAMFREQVKDVLRVGDKDVNDRTMRKRLVYELSRYETGLLERGCPRYLYGTSSPSAADCSLYAMLLRIVGRCADIPPSVPDLWDEPGLANLKSWYDAMEKEYKLDWSSQSAA